jgi:hypothetical protein
MAVAVDTQTQTQSIIPEGYTFLNPTRFVSKKAWDLADTMLEKASNRCPDHFRMYIYNDFHGYGVLDLIDHALSSLHAKIVKKDWQNALVELEALALLMKTEDTYQMVDDGERVELTEQIYFACAIKVLESLKEQNALDMDHIPNLQSLLRLLHETHMPDTIPPRYFQQLARRLFDHQWLELEELKIARVEAWTLELEEEDRGEVKRMMEEEEEENGPDYRWYLDDEDEGEEDGREVKLTPAWKEYKGYLRGVPTRPLRGPPNWDISKWSDAQKAPFLLKNIVV